MVPQYKQVFPGHFLSFFISLIIPFNVLKIISSFSGVFIVQFVNIFVSSSESTNRGTKTFEFQAIGLLASRMSQLFRHELKLTSCYWFLVRLKLYSISYTCLPEREPILLFGFSRLWDQKINLFVSLFRKQPIQLQWLTRYFTWNKEFFVVDSICLVSGLLVISWMDVVEFCFPLNILCVKRLLIILNLLLLCNIVDVGLWSSEFGLIFFFLNSSARGRWL